MDAVGCRDIQLIIDESYRLCSEFNHPKAKLLLQHALASCISETPFSIDVAFMLDALALACKEMEQFSEAAVYLAQSLAIKKLMFGDSHPDILMAKDRLDACTLVPISELLSQTRGQWESNSSEPRERNSSVLECLVNGKTRQGYSVMVIEDGRQGRIITALELQPGERVPAMVVSINCGELYLMLCRKWAMKRQVEQSFGKACSV